MKVWIKGSILDPGTLEILASSGDATKRRKACREIIIFQQTVTLLLRIIRL